MGRTRPPRPPGASLSAIFLTLVLAASMAHATPVHRSPPPDVDSVFGFQELELEAPPVDAVASIADPSATAAFVDHAYVEDVLLGKRRLRVYVTLYKGLVESIELQPADSDDMADLQDDLIKLYGRPTRRTAFETRWEGRRAVLVWTHLYGATIVTLTSRRLAREMDLERRNL
jgi:hypothetical protein